MMYPTFRDMTYIFQQMCACRSILRTAYVILSWITAEMISSEAISLYSEYGRLFPAELKWLWDTEAGWLLTGQDDRPQASICKSW